MIPLDFWIQDDGLSDEEAAKNTYEKLEKEYTKRVLNDIMNDKQLERISPGIGKLLCDQFRAVTVVDRTCQQLSKEMADHLAEYEKKLKKEHRFRSLIQEWISEKIGQEKASLVSLDFLLETFFLNVLRSTWTTSESIR